MNILKYYILPLIVISMGCLSCSDDYDNNNGGVPLLESYGPSPALRGGQLTFIGKNLDKVSKVILPDNIEITTIEVLSNERIKVTIPQNAGVGYVKLIAGGTELTSKTLLTYTEPISISKISPNPVKAGQTLTIEGDYLNLIQKVIFADNVEIECKNFLKWERGKIEVTVPREAQTGTVILADTAAVPIELKSETELQVVLPAITKISPSPIKAGELLTIEGTDFDLVDSLAFEGNVGTRKFVSRTDTKIEINVPENAADGNVRAIAFSGVAVESPDPLILIAPAITSIAPDPVKNGATLTVTGKNLDLVSRVVFAGDKEAEIQEGTTASEMKVTVPVDAAPGVVTFYTLANKTVQSKALNFIEPVISGIDPATILAGSSVTITGTDMDLVKKVIFGGDTEGKILNQSATSIEVESLPNSQSGAITLVTSNGTEVKSEQQITITSDMPVITSITPDPVKPGALITIAGSKLNLVESITFEDGIKATKYGMRSEALIEVYVPEDAKKGTVTLILIAYDGKQVISPSFTVSGTDPVLDQSYVFFDFDAKGSWWGSFGGVENDPSLSISGNYFRINKDLSGGWIDFFWRNGGNDFKTDGVTVDDWVIKMDVNVLGATTPPFKFRLKGSSGDYWAIFGGLENKGGWYTVTIALTDFFDKDGLGTNPLPNVQDIDQDFGLALAGEGMTNICIDNIRFEKK